MSQAREWVNICNTATLVISQQHGQLEQEEAGFLSGDRGRREASKVNSSTSGDIVVICLKAIATVRDKSQHNSCDI